MSRTDDMTIEIVDRVGDYGCQWRCLVDILNDSCCVAWHRRATGGAGPWERDDEPPERVRRRVVDVLSEHVLELSGVAGE